MSRRGEQWQAPAVTNLVVKHGFLQVDEEHPSSQQAQGLAWRRVRSDSELWRRGSSDEGEGEEAPEYVQVPEDDVWPGNKLGPVTLPEAVHFSHVRISSQGSDTTADTAAGATAQGLRPPSAERAFSWSHEDSGSGGSTPVRGSMDDKDRLLAENARLELENQRLRQQCMESACAAQVPAVMPHVDSFRGHVPHVSQQGPHGQHGQHGPHSQQGHGHKGSYHMGLAPQGLAPQQQQNVVWVPLSFAMQQAPPSPGAWCPMPMLPPSPAGGPAVPLAAAAEAPRAAAAKAAGSAGAQPGLPSRPLLQTPKKAPQAKPEDRPQPGGLPSHVQRRLASQRNMWDEDNVTDVPIEARTTVMLRNLPNNYTRDMLVRMMDEEGFAGQYDFVYLPVDFRTHASLGYAFVNLVAPSVVARFWKTFDGFTRWALPSRKVCFVSWCGPHQGYEAHVLRYRSSPVMHPSVPDEYKPCVFQNGVRVEFPMPVKKPRMPRVRNYVRSNQ